MDAIPKTTLTQKRSQITSGAKKLKKEKLEHDDQENSPDKGAIMKIVIWIVVVVFIGVGAALFLTNILSGNSEEIDQPEEIESYPVVSEETEELYTDDDLDTENEEDLENEDQLDTENENENEEEVLEEDSDNEDDQTEEDTTTVAQGNLEEYSLTDRVKPSENSGKTLILNKFRYYETNTEFNYIFSEVSSTSSTIDPSIKLYYEKDTNDELILEFSNVYRDNVTGNENTTTRSFPDIPGLISTKTENHNGVSKYRFYMSDKYKSRVLIDNNAKTIKLQIDTR